MALRQSVAWWAVARQVQDLPPFFAELREIGYQGIELLPPEHWPAARDAGLAIVTETAGAIESGWNRRENHRRLRDELRGKLDEAQRAGVLNLIVFSGNREGLDDATGAAVTAEGLKAVAHEAEAAGVTLLLELLNSRRDHPDYQCDHTEWGAAVVRAVNSPNVRLLYDIYHAQVMEGDLILNLTGHVDLIGHLHTAGNPGRNDLDDRQEIHYPALIQAAMLAGYDGWVGQEFVPRGEVLPALRQAFERCHFDPPTD